MTDATMNREIKSVIEEFPTIEQILSEYGVGCGACTVGTCLVKDIVTIHVLSAAQEAELMERFALVFKGEVEAALALKSEAKPMRIIYSTPVQKLVDEHVLIKRFIALIPTIVESLDLETEESRNLMAMGIDMIRSYADRFHHAKEEDILFKYTDESAEIINVMYDDHKNARAHVRAMIKGVEGLCSGGHEIELLPIIGVTGSDIDDVYFAGVLFVKRGDGYLIAFHEFALFQNVFQIFYHIPDSHGIYLLKVFSRRSSLQISPLPVHHTSICPPYPENKPSGVIRRPDSIIGHNPQSALRAPRRRQRVRASEKLNYTPRCNQQHKHCYMER